MTPIDAHSPGATLARSLADAAVVVDGDDRVLAWNAGAEIRLGVTVGLVGQTLAALGLANLPGATRLPLSPASAADPAVAVVTWASGGSASQPDLALQKARAMARLAAGVTHDMRNHISGFSAFSALLRAERTLLSPEDEALLRDLDANADRVALLFEAFTLLARQGAGSRRTMLLASAVDGALALAAFQMINVQQTVSVPADLPELAADRVRLHQALVALVVNVLDAFGQPDPRGSLDVRARVLPGDPPQSVELVFEDDAPTVPESSRAALFEPRPPAGSARRAGLDLAAARRLVEADGGTLRYEPGPRGENRLVLTLPIARAGGTGEGQLHAQATGSTADADDARAVGDAPGAGHPADTAQTETRPGAAGRAGELSILVCDDEEMIRTLLSRTLERNHRVVQVASAAEALDAIERQPIDIVMTDHRLAGMSGTELHAEVMRRHPTLGRRFILMSGNAADEELETFRSETGLRVLWKPFNVSGLDALVRDVAGG